MSQISNLFFQLYQLSKKYDMYLTGAVILIWLYFRLNHRVKQVEEQLIESKKSMLDTYFPARKPFEPADVLNAEEMEGKVDEISELKEIKKKEVIEGSNRDEEEVESKKEI
ncbi:hypothetical protein K502DRAFT_330142 [Neoconidiobolus thromboides FSU 785]|nr:hypothetical protein K502DRAFT_330142 [Neoconidiobolus thromboides FSU 785]